jgi:hypothetical protein
MNVILILFNFVSEQYFKYIEKYLHSKYNVDNIHYFNENFQ